MPNVGDFSGEQCPRFAPVRSIVVANLAHPIRIIDSCALSPSRVILNTIGRIAY